jgi:hypothetical protein
MQWTMLFDVHAGVAAVLCDRPLHLLHPVLLTGAISAAGRNSMASSLDIESIVREGFNHEIDSE